MPLRERMEIMTDENEKKITLQALPKCVDESAKALILPAATETGNFLADLLYHLTGKFHLSAEKKRAKDNHELQIFKDELARELSAKPAECLDEPKQQVVGQAFEQAKNCLEEEEIRKMFVRLISNAADVRYQAFVHPAFPSMIAQMSPLDAENLALFYPDKRFPIADLQIQYEDGTHKTLFQNCFLENLKMHSKAELELEAASIESLCRLGITKSSYIECLSDDKQYEKFMRSIPMLDAQLLLEEALKLPVPDGLSKVKRVKLRKGVVELTPLGKTFAKVCLST